MVEVVRAMNFLIDQGLAFYWGTSEWSAQMIEEAKGIAKEAGPLMAPPIFEQVSYSMLMRERVEMEHRRYRQPDSRTVLAFAGMAMGPFPWGRVGSPISHAIESGTITGSNVTTPYI
jgi:aryl-alcohol dehydrogenase-like predicted oxidoreductase